MRIDIEMTAVKKMLENLAVKQLPYTFARALTLTAENARDKIITQLPSRFVLRTSWWKPRTRYGFNIKPAKKNYLAAEIFTRAPWMVLHEEGGIKKPIESRTLAIPTENIRRDIRQKITKSKLPSAIMRATKRPGFILPTRSGPVIFRRTSKRKIKAMYVLEKQVKIQPRLEMRKTCEQILNERIFKNFEYAFREAIKTAK